MRPLTHSEVIAMMEPVGEIMPNDAGLTIRLYTPDARPAVYAWVVGGEVLYIGKAGRGLKRRTDQWRGGFRGTGRGGRQAALLIERAAPVVWMAMWPEAVPFRSTLIPSHSSVEEWLIAATTPTPVMNREAK